MRIWILVLLGAPLLWFAIVEPILRRPVRIISIVLLGILFLPNLVLEVRWQYTEHVGTQVVQKVSGKSSGYLHCERLSETLFDAQTRAGEVRSDQPDKAFATWDTCKNFQSFVLGDKQHPTLDQITAIHVIVHEAVHVSGEYNEALTECRAMAVEASIDETLGASPAMAKTMAQQYRQQVYPLLPDAYHTQCP